MRLAERRAKVPSAKATMEGWRFYYNFIRPHQGLGGLTPAQVAGLPVPVEGNRWMALIQSAAGTVVSPATQQEVQKERNPP